MPVDKCVGCNKNIAINELIEMPDGLKKICQSCIKIIENIAKASHFFVNFIISEYKED